MRLSLFIDFDPSDNQRTLGKFLKSIREEREISLEDLAEITRIRTDYLEGIESDHFEALRSGPYLNLFLKSYCEALDIDYQKIVEHLQALQLPEAMPKARPAVQRKPPEPKKTVRPEIAVAPPAPYVPVPESEPKIKVKKAEPVNPWLFIGVGVFLVAIIFVIVMMASGNFTGSHTKKARPESIATTDSLPVDSGKIKLEQFLGRFDSLTISIYPASQQAITIVADGIRQTKLANPEWVWPVTARDSLRINCERQDSSRFYLNGYRVPFEKATFHDSAAVTFNRLNWIQFVDTMDAE